MEQTAFVNKVNGELAEVLVYRTSACGEGCGGNCMVCGTSKPIQITARNLIGAVPGDRVVLESESRLVLRLSFFTYILPILAMIFGYALGSLLGLKESLSALVAFVALIVGFSPAAVINRNIKKKNYVTYNITQKM